MRSLPSGENAQAKHGARGSHTRVVQWSFFGSSVALSAGRPDPCGVPWATVQPCVLGRKTERRHPPLNDAGMVEPLIENRTFEEIHVGERAVLERTSAGWTSSYSRFVSGDVNPGLCRGGVRSQPQVPPHRRPRRPRA
jgi:hypothetical protein